METQEEKWQRFSSVAKVEHSRGGIMLRVEVTDDGFLYLYDELTGRVVSHQGELTVVLDESNGRYQSVTIKVETDGRLKPTVFAPTVKP